ncbi:thiol-disulfide oxidoreductase DCC family protein [Oceanobacillus sp. CFH 90083]|uniref:thiol-disulfide oxidoreductase DCC family protein n=1 Tax=Oceanobacillus sp. CFH 90083 TaxID=2592336 RepID=UPI00128C931C|nr:thiol-disulfide oxidoreductase DCC family protein [Oceanobacillus sp. CFH 90083]
MKLILFDGECHVCDSFVQFILKRDKQHQFLFISLQSEAGAFIRRKYRVPDNLDSVLLIDGEKIFIKSDAALQVLQSIPAPWKMLTAAKILPYFIRDALYDFVARNRYRIFRKKQTCRLPTAQERKQFVESKADLAEKKPFA